MFKGTGGVDDQNNESGATDGHDETSSNIGSSKFVSHGMIDILRNVGSGVVTVEVISGISVHDVMTLSHTIVVIKRNTTRSTGNTFMNSNIKEIPVKDIATAVFSSFNHIPPQS